MNSNDTLTQAAKMTPEEIGKWAEYWGELAQQKADLDARRGVSMPVSYYASTVVGALLATQRAQAASAAGMSLVPDHTLTPLQRTYLAQTQPAQAAQPETALQKYTRFKVDEIDGSPLEKLRAFCAFAMNEQDWFDVEPFFDLVREAQAAQSEQEAELFALKTSLKYWQDRCTSAERNWGELANAQAAQGAGEAVCIDLDRLNWETVKQAAAESKWIPQDLYYVNDWLADVCTFLRDGAGAFIDTPPTQPAPVVPEGWKLVPVEPTEEMLAAVRKEMNWCDPVGIFGKMIKATPTPPAQAAQQGEKA